MLRIGGPLWRAFGVVRDMNEYVTSPTLPTEGAVGSHKELSDALTLDLQDWEISKLGSIIGDVWGKYIGRRYDTVEQGMEIVSQAEAEMTHRIAEELEVLVSMDVSPMLTFEPPILEVHGKLPNSSFAKYGFDHEQKEWEVKKATARDEAFLGEKEDPNRSAKTKKRAQQKRERRARRAQRNK